MKRIIISLLCLCMAVSLFACETAPEISKSDVSAEVSKEEGYGPRDITVNGVSLTVCEPTDDSFSVAIIPYTHEHTNFHTIEVGTKVNIEFDIIGKYIARMIKK